MPSIDQARSYSILTDSAGNEVSVAGGALDVNAVLDASVYKAYSTTDNLVSTTLTGALNAVDTGPQNIFSDTTGLPPSGYIMINGSEIIEYDSVDSSTQLTLTAGGRGSFGSQADSYTGVEPVSQVYATGVLTLDGYSQVMTKIHSDQDIQQRFQWYSDVGGTNVIRTLAPTFFAATGYDFLSSVAFGPYVRYIAAPVDTTTTSFFFTTEFSNRATNPQLLTLNSAVFGSMVSQLSRSVLVGLEPQSGAFANVNLTTDAELLTNTLAANRKSRVCYEDAAVAADQYVLLIDLDNSGGEWPHNYFGSIDVDHIMTTLSFASGTAECVIRVGLITRIDGTDADVSWLINQTAGAQSANDSRTLVANYQPSSVVFKEEGGTSAGALTGVVDTNIAAINTGVALPSPAGTTTPAVGDVILKYEYVADTFAAATDVLYHSDA